MCNVAANAFVGKQKKTEKSKIHFSRQTGTRIRMLQRKNHRFQDDAIILRADIDCGN